MDRSKLDNLVMCAVLATFQREEKAPLTYSWCLLLLTPKTNFPTKN